jgi:Xaa-Pro dipeptidase
MMLSSQDIAALKAGVAPITATEMLGRVDRAQQLMRRNGIDALFLEAGTGLRYFTGVHHWQSERMIAAVIPARGEISYVCPAFEEARFREMLSFGDDVRVWEEHESPYERVVQVLRDRGVAGGVLALDESTRFFLFDGIRRAAPQLHIVSGDPVTIPCRSCKSPAEIALMQRAAAINTAAYRVAISMLHEGMSQPEFAANAEAALKALGVPGGIGAQFGAGTAFPHGTREPQFLREGDVVLMDGVCSLEGYHSDISRVVVFGQPTQRQRDVWHLEQEAQAAAFAAAQIGAPCEDVDAAARKVITDAGFGPDYKVPGLPHRTGHGIGLDIHEWHYLVRGNRTPLAPGMCFTNEPMIAIYGEFGVRLEDCFYMTEDGPRWFTLPSPSITQPFA